MCRLAVQRRALRLASGPHQARRPPDRRRACGRRAASRPASDCAFQPGDSVLGNFKGLGDWDEARWRHADGTYTLEYTDEGLVEEHAG